MIHSTAIIDDGAVIGPETRVWHWTHVTAGAVVGRGCSLGQNVYVGGGARLGDNVRVQNNVSIYDAVLLEDDVFCGPSAVFTNVLNPRAAVPRKDEYRATVVRRGATIGANATIICGVTIGQYAFVGAGAVVTHDVPDYGLVMGVPARLVGWMSDAGERLALPLDRDGEAICRATGAKYRAAAGLVSKLS